MSKELKRELVGCTIRKEVKGSQSAVIIYRTTITSTGDKDQAERVLERQLLYCCRPTGVYYSYS